MNYHLEKLRRNGFKLTPRRKAIVDLFEDCDSHLTPEEVWRQLKKKFHQCGLPSVYRNLESLADCDILTRIQQFDRKKHYGLCCAKHNEHHHHITCLKCGTVEDVKDCAIKGIKKIKGYKVINHFMQINGICPDCAKR